MKSNYSTSGGPGHDAETEYEEHCDLVKIMDYWLGEITYNTLSYPYYPHHHPVKNHPQHDDAFSLQQA